MTFVAELLPNINELFDWRGIFSQHTLLEFNKTALMAFVSTIVCVLFFWLGARKQALVPDRHPEPRRDGLRGRRGEREPGGDR